VTLTRAEFDWVLDFAETGGDSLRAYDVYKRITQFNGRFIAASDEAAQRHRMMIGTITSDAMVTVKYQRGGSLGSVEESFISRLKPGDAFFFAGRTLELIRIRDMKAYVRLAKSRRVRSRGGSADKCRCRRSSRRRCATCSMKSPTGEWRSQRSMPSNRS
jgi:ATP-dependent helicase Lhr and Lhr-like helicase